MSTTKKQLYWQIAVINKISRLKQGHSWTLVPAFISLSFVTILIGHLLPSVNPRLGNMAKTIPFSATVQQDGSMWISIFPLKEDIVVITSDRKKFIWPKQKAPQEALLPFQEYLKEKVQHESLATGLSMQANLTRTSVVLAVDQRLKYAHILPIIYALARAGISRYGFETNLHD